MTGNKVFADTFYWVAVSNPKDSAHFDAVETRQMLGEIIVITTETVLIEVLNYFAEDGLFTRQSAVDAVRTIIEDDEIEYISHSPDIFLEALDFYEKRLDKGYCLTDCVPMLTMKTLKIHEILTYDNHFEQEGFTVLL